MKTFYLILFAALLFAGCSTQARSVTFSVMGDGPEFSNQYDPFKKLIQTINERNTEFVVHVGDIKPKEKRCTSFAGTVAIIDQLNKPFHAVPGDWDWSRCEKPREALNLWINSFNEQQWSFTKNGVTFIGVNVVGGEPFDEQEWHDRHQRSLDYIQEHIGGRATVIFFHATMVQPGNHQDFLTGLLKIANEYQKPLLTVNGDGSYRHFEKKGNVLMYQSDNLAITEITVTPSGKFLIKNDLDLKIEERDGRVYVNGKYVHVPEAILDISQLDPEGGIDRIK